MTETTLQITVEELKKMLDESFLSAETKNAFTDLLADMNDDEKTQLIKIIEEGNNAKTTYETERLEKLARLNAALKKHLQDVTQKENRYIREEFEKFGSQEDEQEMQNIEEQIKNL